MFFAFRIMVATGMLMLAVSWLAWWRLRRTGWRTEVTGPRWLWRALALMTFSGWVATVAGWYVTEIGRQPYLVYGVLQTADLVTTTPAATVAWSLGGYLVLYVGLLLAYVAVLRYLASKPLDAAGPDPIVPGMTPEQGLTQQGA